MTKAALTDLQGMLRSHKHMRIGKLLQDKKSNLVWRAITHNCRWQVRQASVSITFKRRFSVRSVAETDKAAKMNDLPLAGIKVLDLTRVLAGVIRIS